MLCCEASRQGLGSQVEELVKVGADPLKLPDGPPCPLQKALAGWELLEQLGETQSLSQMG